MDEDQLIAGGRVFREAWIAGVRKHFPGEPKPGYVASWEDTADWEKAAAVVVYEQVRTFLGVTAGAAAKLSRTQKGQFVAACWTGQVYQHFADPKPSYVAEWNALPEWWQETDADVFEHIENNAGQE
ncbi:hypothetical protein [Kutzneria buriramensis]|uniref:Uncharacterized protein n=1 Tax=Kutzneria buriramensis TaxID=1045776 RepID=A0A3E0HIU0_9PSEU|nr:hypothetical protein [Kutzneria buriramensis]REH46312.1 hypothetical protein BCF44_107445 [Kutzneria buriramensis]